MTEPEVIEMVNLYASNSMGCFSLWVSFTFAYLTVAYLVGSKLSKTQLYIISTLYVLAGGAFAFAAVTYTESFSTLNSVYPEFSPTDLWRFPWTLASSLILTGGMLSSLYFMWDVRRLETE
jgi:hypothetical protein